MIIMMRDPHTVITMKTGDGELKDLTLDGYLSEAQLSGIENIVIESGYSDPNFEVYRFTGYEGVTIRDKHRKCDLIVMQFPNTPISREQTDFISESIHSKYEISVGIGGNVSGDVHKENVAQVMAVKPHQNRS